MSKIYIAVIVCLLGALVYVAIAPFEPASFFSIGGIAIVGVVWAIIALRNEIIKGENK